MVNSIFIAEGTISRPTLMNGNSRMWKKRK